MKIGRGRRVLVLDGDMVPALTIARSLYRCGCEITVGSHVHKPPSSYSRTVSRVVVYPDPLSEAAALVDWLEEHTRQVDYDLVIPVTERTLVSVARHRERFTHVKVAMPDDRGLELVLDKSQTLALAESLGVPIPRSVTVQSLDELAQQRDRWRYPVVLKPARSIGSREGGASHLQVSYAFDPIGLVTGAGHALRFGPVVLQEYFRGEGVGVELIASRGEIAYAFQHRRLHEVPLTGGGSSLRISEPVAPSLLEASKKLIDALHWSGVAMVEFKYDAASGNFCLMEINGRFWGSLPLALAAGADFPAMLLSLELEGAVAPSGDYRNGTYCRLLSKDLMWYEAVLRGGEDERIVPLPSYGEVFRSLALMLHPRHHFDVQSLGDPLPGLVDTGRILRTYARRLHTLLSERWYLLRQRLAWRRGRVAQAISGAQSILFVCYGNINRSALADAMVRGYAQDAGVDVVSAGFHPQAGRPADPVMIEVAADHGVDMKSLESTTLDTALLRNSDIIFVMEKRHRDRLLAMAPGIDDKVFLLGGHPGGQGEGPEIPDPFGLTREDYLYSFSRVAQAIDHIKAVLAMRSVD